MTLNLSFEDLASVISVSLLMAKIDDDFRQEECEAILDTLFKQYNFKGKDDLLRQYFDYANKMDFKEVVQRIAKFGPNEKQFFAEMLARTMAADGKITPDEEELYTKCMNAFDLPDPSVFFATTGSVQNDTIAPTYLSYTYGMAFRYDGLVTAHQIPNGKDFHQGVLENNAPIKTITKWTEPPILKVLTEKMGLQNGRKLCMWQSDKDVDFTSEINKVGYLLTSGIKLTGSVKLCIWSPQNRFEGITSKSVVVWLVNAIDTLCKGTSLVTLGYEDAYPNESIRMMDFVLKKLDELR